MSRGDRTPWRLTLLLSLGLLAAAFTYFNAAERISIHIGFAVLFQLPLVGVVLSVFLLGMLAMYLLGLAHDLRVRRVLRDHGLEELLDEADEYGSPAPRPPDSYP